MTEERTPRPEGKGWVYDEEQKHWFRIRKLTPRECFRLMGVADKDIDTLMMMEKVVKKGAQIEKQIISNSQLYKLAGNSIVVDVMFYMFRNLFLPERAPKQIGEEQLTLF